jgi:hypothetical protein
MSTPTIPRPTVAHRLINCPVGHPLHPAQTKASRLQPCTDDGQHPTRTLEDHVHGAYQAGWSDSARAGDAAGKPTPQPDADMLSYAAGWYYGLVCGSVGTTALVGVGVAIFRLYTGVGF